MAHRAVGPRNEHTKFSYAIAAAFLLAVAFILHTMVLRAQPLGSPTARSAVVPRWEVDAGGKMAFNVASVEQNTASPQVSESAPTQPPAPAADQPKFDVASIKVNNSGDGRHSLSLGLPGGRVTGTNVSLASLMTSAYEVPINRISGTPAWFDSEHFDLQAISEGDLTFDQKRLGLQSLLADRFKLTLHRETRKLPVFALVLAKPGKLGPQLHLNDKKCDSTPATGLPSPAAALGTASSVACGGISGETTRRRVRYAGQTVTMDSLLVTLAGPSSNPNVDRPIVDRTGLSGTVDFTLEFAPLQLEPSSSEGSANASALPSFFTALQEQLGLKLEPQTGPVDVLVIDHVEQPSEN